MAFIEIKFEKKKKKLINKEKDEKGHIFKKKYQLHAGLKKKQVTRGHNIAADGWAGASISIHIQTHPQHSNIHKSI